MRERVGLSAVRIVYFIPAVLFLVSCTVVRRVDIPTYTVTAYSRYEKLPLNVSLDLSEVRDYKWEGKIGDVVEVIPLGEHLTHNSERLARHIFANIAILSGRAALLDAGTDAVLTPKIIFFERVWGKLSMKDEISTIALEWTLKSREGDLIWVDTVQGSGHGKADERVKMFIEEVFQKSYQSMASAKAMKDFAAKTQSGGVGAGVFRSIAEGVDHMVAVTGTIKPNMTHHRVYDDMYQAYVKAYEGLTSSGTFDTLARIQGV